MERRLIINVKDREYLIDPMQIIYINAEGSYAVIFSEQTSPLRVAKNLQQISRLIPKGCPFLLRVHRSWIVNVNMISFFSRVDKHYVAWLQGGMQVPISTLAVKERILALLRTTGGTTGAEVDVESVGCVK